MNKKLTNITFLFFLIGSNSAFAYDIFNPPKSYPLDKSFEEGMTFNNTVPGIDSNSQDLSTSKTMRSTTSFLPKYITGHISLNTIKNQLGNMKTISQSSLQNGIGVHIEKKISLKVSGISPQPYEGFYIFNSNEIEVGYCLIENLDVTLFFNDDIRLKDITTKYIQNPLYLQGKINMFQNSSITFYEKEVDGYIERYGFADILGKKLMILDAFYPKELEPEFKPKIIKRINKNLEFFYNSLTNRPNQEDELEE